MIFAISVKIIALIVSHIHEFKPNSAKADP